MLCSCGKEIHETAISCPDCGAQTYIKNRVIAAVFACFSGGFGLHKFYLNKKGLGILYLCFCWTLIPSFLGIIEAILYLYKSNEEFNKTYNSKLQ